MKELNLKISDRVYNELRSSIIVKGIAGALYGTADAFITRVIKGIEDNQEELIIAFKKDDPEKPEE
jgi:hypothetical protein